MRIHLVRPAGRALRRSGRALRSTGRAPTRVLALVGASLGFGCGADDDLPGAWRGYVEAQGQRLEMRFDLSEAPYGHTGTLDLPTVGVLDWPLSQVVLEDGSVRIDFRSDQGMNYAVGTIDGGRITGRAEFIGIGEGAMTLERTNESAGTFETEEITFTSGDVTLAGRITLPEGPGPHPAIVFVHGSGDVPRDAFNFHAARYAEIGVATLGFDKRGVGESTGSWREVGFDELAADVLAAVAVLVDRPDIDAARIGLQGQSQGGWTAPLAASRSDDVAFVVTISGPLVTPAVEGHWDNARSLAQAGYGRAEIERTVAVLRLADEAIRSGDGWEAVQRATEALYDEPWFGDSRLPREWSMSVERQAWYRGMMDFDPVPVFRGLDIPVLAIYGAEDESIPAEQSAAAVRAFAQREGKPFEVAWFPDADHSLRVVPTPGRFSWPGYAPGFLETLSRWVGAVVAS